MNRDGRRVPEGAHLEADLCIIGAGPTGIALARACDGMGLSVLLLESGGRKAESWAQDLNEGQVVGDRYAGLVATRHRRVGGSAAIWNSRVRGGNGAKYVPLDRSDIDSAGADWPIEWDDLAPYYRAAQGVCGLGPFAYDAATWAEAGRAPLLTHDRLLASAVYQYGSGGLFTKDYVTALVDSPRVQLYPHATVCALITDSAGRRVTEARIRSPSGAAWSAHATVFVLAAGTIENTRMLLWSAATRGPGLGNEGGILGRFFMEHPRDSGMVLTPRHDGFYREAGFYDIHSALDRSVIAGRFGLTAAARAESRLPNASVSLVPLRAEVPDGAGVLARLRSRLGRLRLPGATDQVGWSRRGDAGRVFAGLTLYTNLEQRPHRENRLVLSSALDRLGVPRVELHWRWRPEEQAALERLRGLVKESFEEGGLGSVAVATGSPPDPNAHHHSGTTRMSRDPRDGVVDPDTRVHGTDNLYVSGASVFPTAGFANPTLTCIALALRLAGHLQGVFGSTKGGGAGS